MARSEAGEQCLETMFANLTKSRFYQILSCSAGLRYAFDPGKGQKGADRFLRLIFKAFLCAACPSCSPPRTPTYSTPALSFHTQPSSLLLSHQCQVCVMQRR